MYEDIQQFIDLANEPGLELTLSNQERVEQALKQLPLLEAKVALLGKSERRKLVPALFRAAGKLRDARAVLSGKVGFFPTARQERQRQELRTASIVVWGN